MRLRLAIHRHGLPEAHILWNSKGLHAVPNGNSSKSTVAQFLQQLNEVIPLEAEDWGLEDYVVEVGGFECVHFSELDSVFKEDDEVSIRPLELNDRRYRRVSGRVQISADGRRLYDGVAFGRPFIRKARRPPVRIPSAEKARITYDTDDDTEEDNEDDTNSWAEAEAEVSRQMMLLQDSPDNNPDYNKELSPDEIADLAAESVRLDGNGRSMAQNNAYSHSRKRRRTGLGIDDVRVSPRVDSETSSFAGRAQRHQNYPVRTQHIRVSPRSVRFEGEELETPATILAEDDDSDEDDEDYSSDSNENEDSEANKENVSPIRPFVRANSNHRASESSEEESSDYETSDDTSSSGSDSDADLQDSSEDEYSADSISNPSRSSENTSSSDISSSESDSDKAPSRRLKTDSLGKAAAPSVVQQSHKATPPGQGLPATKKRNARRKLKMQFKRAAAAEAAQQNAGQASSNQITETQNGTSIVNHDLERRRAALLRNLNPVDDMDAQQTTPAEDYAAMMGVDPEVTMASIQQDLPDSSPMPEATSSKEAPPSSVRQNEAEQHPVVANSTTSDAPLKTVAASPEQSQPASKSEEAQPSSTKSTPRRSRLDLGSATRMLFGSLGLRAPRSKDDANKLRNKLEEKAQKLPGNMIGPVQPSKPEPVAQMVDENDESWREHINLQAVECCYDVKYSAPPFPFVQRWDPQQQYNNKRKGKGGGGGRGKRQKRNNKQYYQGDQEEYADYGESFVDQSYQDQSYQDQASNLGQADVNMQTESDTRAANEQLLEESQTIPAEVSDGVEFPDLPTDMSTLPELTIRTALPGNIIAFKQMEMSEYTSWCPVISEYRTGKIDSVMDNNILVVHLAQKDLPHKAKNYDPETGERVYSKFEMPNDEESEDEQDDPCLEIGLQDMIEPKLVKVIEHEDDQLNVSNTFMSAVETAKGLVDVGKELLDVVLPAETSIKEKVAETEDPSSQIAGGNDILVLNANGAGIQQADGYIGPHTSASTKDEQEITATGTEQRTPPLREASVELGSCNPPQRFFSELKSSQPTMDPGDEDADAADHEENGFVPLADDTSVIITQDGAADDPSLWHPSTAPFHDESTQFYSPLASQQQEPHLSSPLRVHSDSPPNFSHSSSAVQDLDITSIVTDMPNGNDKPPEAGSEDADGDIPFQDSVDGDEMDKTLTQESFGIEVKTNKKNPLANGSFWDHQPASDSDSDSLLSLKDLLSQPLPVTPPKSKRGKGKKSNYPKIPSTAPETIESYVFSQAPKRLISDTHKIAVNTNDDSFLGSSDKESETGPYELEAQVEPMLNDHSEIEEPELPELPALEKTTPRANNRIIQDTLFIRPPFKRPPSSQPTTSSNSAAVVDLTMSSGPVEIPVEDQEGTPPKRKQPARRVASSMPSGPGWVGNRSLKEKSTGKNKRVLKRTKSLI